MNTRIPLALAVALLPAVALAACGSDDDGGGSPEGTELPEVTTVPPTDPTDPTDPTTDPTVISADVEVVLEAGYYGGFTPVAVAFRQDPLVMVTGDGLVLTPAPMTMQFPGPLVPPVNARTITPAGIDALLAAADEAGMLADVEYEQPLNIADAADAVLRIDTGDAQYVHRAYALGIDSETDEDRRALADFLASLTDLESLVGADELGPESLWEPEGYQLFATPLDQVPSGLDVEPTVVAWPGDAGVSLADASQCTDVDAGAVADLFADATELTYFTEGDTTYEVVVRPAYPGRDC